MRTYRSSTTGIKRRVSREDFESEYEGAKETGVIDDLSIHLHGFTNETLLGYLENPANQLFELIRPNVQLFDQYKAKAVEIDLSHNPQIIEFFKNYKCWDEDWWYIDDTTNSALQGVKVLLEKDGFTFHAARIRQFSKCTTPTANFHIDCPFGIDIDRIQSPTQRAVLQAANFTGYHNFIMTISDNPECTTRYIDHGQFKYSMEEDLNILNLHCKHQTVLNNPNSAVNYNQLCNAYLSQKLANERTLEGTLIPVKPNVLTNVVDYNFHRGPIPDDFKDSKGYVRRTLVHIYCTRS